MGRGMDYAACLQLKAWMAVAPGEGLNKNHWQHIIFIILIHTLNEYHESH
jgi:hypothetical protein